MPEHQPWCPEPNQLSVLLDDTRPIDRAITAHVERCQKCQRELDRLTAGSGLASFRGYYPQSSSGTQLLEEGHELSEQFKIESTIGAGGMGVVYRARDNKLARSVAIKVLNDSSSPTALARFDRETRAVSRLNHPNVVPVYSSGQTENGRPFFVMPLIAGETLSQSLKDGKLDFRDIARIIHQVANGLEAAHQMDLVHRDIKPTNILLDQNESQARLVDFGLARSSEDETLTQVDVICGSPAYMSPEQASQLDKADARSDLYGLGVTLYECLTGVVPFSGTPFQILEQHRLQEPVSPRRLNHSTPIDLETICLKLLEKEPARRYQTATQVADELQNFLAGLPIRARPVGAAGRTLRWAKRNLALATSLVLLFLALLTGTVVSSLLWLQSERNAKIAENRNDSLVASQTVLQENQREMWRALRGTYVFEEGEVTYMEMPTPVRNMFLYEMAVSYRMLFERSRRDQGELREMADELSEACQFAIERYMPQRANELATLHRRIADQLVGLRSPTPPEDLLRAARAYNQVAEARRSSSVDDSRQAFEDARRMAEMIVQNESQQSERLKEKARISAFNSRRGLFRLRIGVEKNAVLASLSALLHEVENSKKSGSEPIRWLDLQQHILVDMTRCADPASLVDIRSRRQSVLKKMTEQSPNNEWFVRKLAVNQTFLGVAHFQIGQPEAGRKHFLEAFERFDHLRDSRALVSRYGADLFESLFLLGGFDWSAGDQENALELYARALKVCHTTVQTNAKDQMLLQRAAQIHEAVAVHLEASSNPLEAARTFVAGAGYAEKAAKAPGAAYDQRNDWRMVESLLKKAASAFDTAGEPQQAAAVREQMSKFTSQIHSPEITN